MLLEILVKRLRIIPVGSAECTLKKKVIFLAELERLGYRIKNPEGYNDSLLSKYKKLISVLKKMKGGDVDYVPLFQGFPDDVPQQNPYFIKRIIGAICSYLTRDAELPAWLFELEKFGADPITQLQNKKLFKKGRKKQRAKKGDVHTEWVDLELVSESEVTERARTYLGHILYAKSSIKEELKPHIEFLLSLDHMGAGAVDPAKVVFKEIQAYLMRLYWIKKDYDRFRPFVGSPTDLLRLFAALTDSDVSLSEPIRFPKFNRPQRRFVLSVLENCSCLAEDMNIYKGLWLELGRYLHPGEYKNRYSKSYKAFDLLRNGKVVTFNSKLEEHIKNKNLDELLPLVVTRPGVFARKLHQILELAGEEPSRKPSDKVLNAFEGVINKVALKNLLVMDSYFSTIEDSEYRTVINKRGKIVVLHNRKERVSRQVLQQLSMLIQTETIRKISEEKETWNHKSVWIDPKLRNYTVPLQQRAASDGLMTIGRGSKISLERGKVLRLFVYWKQKKRRTDLDLSLIQYDKNMIFQGHVSYTNLSSGGIVHSGDLQSAPYGAAEFIDIDLGYLEKQKNIQYIAPQVYRYCGESFVTMDECYAGWMIRDKVSKEYKSFDIKTVQNKFDLKGSGSYCIPIIIDVKERAINFIDLYVGGLSQHNRVEGAESNISIISQEMVKMHNTRPNMLDLAMFNRKGRKGIVAQTKKSADITIGIKGCDYNVTEIEKILCELI